MKIIDIQRFINEFKLLTEAVTLPNIRQGILGKKGKSEYPVIDSDKEWYEEHKFEFLKAIEKVLNADDKTLQIKLQKFDTDPYFTKGKPRKLKPKELLKAVKRNFISQVERSRMTEEKTSGIGAQYEMMEMKNGVEVYAVYTPMANRYLTHTKLHVDGCFSPTWCIASSTANNYWNTYHLYEAEYPSVFIVAQKVKNSYNPIKYELKCNPHNSVSFKDGEISLKDWVDEWREPEQEEKSYDQTSLFKFFNISSQELEEVIRKLIKSKKAETFSKNFGKEMLNFYEKKINSKDEDTKMEYLTKACKNGTFINFCRKIDIRDMDYFLDELIRYETLTEAEVYEMDLIDDEKAILYLIKNKRCSTLSLEWANRYFDNDMVKSVYYAIPDEILFMENDENDDENGVEIIDLIEKDKELIYNYVERLVTKDKVEYKFLYYVKDNPKLLEKCIESLISTNKINKYVLGYVKNIPLLEKCIDSLIINGKVDKSILSELMGEEKSKLLEKCVDHLISNDDIDTPFLRYVINNEKLFKKCVEYLIYKKRVDNGLLYYVKDNEKILEKCVEVLISNDKIDYYTLDAVSNNEKMMEKCVEHLISKDKVNKHILLYVKNNEEMLKKCLDYLISRGDITKDDIFKNTSLRYFIDDESLYKNCEKYIIS